MPSDTQNAYSVSPLFAKILPSPSWQGTESKRYQIDKLTYFSYRSFISVRVGPVGKTRYGFSMTTDLNTWSKEGRCSRTVRDFLRLVHPSQVPSSSSLYRTTFSILGFIAMAAAQIKPLRKLIENKHREDVTIIGRLLIYGST